MVRLAEYSRDCLVQLRADTGIAYDDKAQGTLQLFRTQKQVDAAAKDIAVLQEAGVPYEVLDPAACAVAEPALAAVSGKIAGGLRLPGDETGDCFKFTNNLAKLAADLREPVTGLWLGRDAHLVHYPVKAGAMINIVAIVRDEWHGEGWSAAGRPSDLLPRFAHFAPAARALLTLPGSWQKWALFDRAPQRIRAQGPATLLGDAAHPMLPFLAQGGAMAIEDAAVLARCLEQSDEPVPALRAYEHARAARAARAQREARRNSWRYHLSGPLAFGRDMVLRGMGGERLLHRYDWLYDWKP